MKARSRRGHRRRPRRPAARPGERRGRPTARPQAALFTRTRPGRARPPWTRARRRPTRRRRRRGRRCRRRRRPPSRAPRDVEDYDSRSLRGESYAHRRAEPAAMVTTATLPSVLRHGTTTIRPVTSPRPTRRYPSIASSSRKRSTSISSEPARASATTSCSLRERPPARAPQRPLERQRPGRHRRGPRRRGRPCESGLPPRPSRPRSERLVGADEVETEISASARSARRPARRYVSAQSTPRGYRSARALADVHGDDPRRRLAGAAALPRDRGRRRH